MDELAEMSREELQDYIVKLEESLLDVIGGSGPEAFDDLGDRFDRLVEESY